MACDIIFQIPD